MCIRSVRNGEMNGTQAGPGLELEPSRPDRAVRLRLSELSELPCEVVEMGEMERMVSLPAPAAAPAVVLDPLVPSG
jgi:hypothetical protein